MDLKQFIATEVKPGEPLTAQAWNDIVGAVDSAHKVLRASMHTVKVKIANAELPPGAVRVVATRSDGAPVEAVAPVQAGDPYVLSRLEEGAYTVFATAVGYATKQAALTVSQTTADLEMSLSPSGALMPDLFGVTLRDALAALTGVNIVVSRLLDFTGADLPPQQPDADYLGAPVLIQVPAAGTPTVSAKLVIAVQPKAESAVEVPSLAGMTEAEARKALEALGLVLGKVKTLTKPA